MNQKKKRFFPITLAIWPYLYVVLSYVFSAYEELYGMFFWGGMVLTLVVYISNIIYACICKGEDSYYHLAFWNMLIKLIHIPFYLGVFLVGAVFLLVAVVPIFTFMAPLMILFLFFVDVFLMITSSMYGVSALVRASKKQVVSKTYAIINIILQFLFIADVISAIVLYIKVRKKRLHS
ncbi:MAG: hypothetical protein HDQ97_13205 [Lachnospiraceae bacterium]|nr:hypothetical protein [Lachnospiraceae bacterium]